MSCGVEYSINELCNQYKANIVFAAEVKLLQKIYLDVMRSRVFILEKRKL